MRMPELSAAVSLRADILARILPRTPIADRCRLEPLHLDVQGQLGRYRISLVWGLVAVVADSGLRWLKIPQKLLTAVPLELADLPIELDYRTETILRKADLLANDWEIKDAELIQEFMPTATPSLELRHRRAGPTGVELAGALKRSATDHGGKPRSGK